MECFRCGISGEEERLVDAIFQDEIVKSCENCVYISGLTVIRKPTTHQLKAAERNPGVYERLARARGISIKERLTQEEKEEKNRIDNELKKYNVTLKDLIDKRINLQKEKTSGEKIDKKPLNLVDNFHWIIMRARRDRKMTHEQLAKEIGESVIVLKMAEQGKLPDDDYNLIPKLETFFKIKLRQDSQYPMYEERKEAENKAIEVKRLRKINFDPVTLKNLTIADLQEMKRKRHEEKRLKEIKEDIKESLEDEEIDEILEGKEEIKENNDKKWWQVWR